MTSTNDGKDVKSNQISGQKGKTYYIDLYKSLDSALVGVGGCSAVCAAWRGVHTLCEHSAPPTHPHLAAWIQRHTAHLLLQSEWQSPKSKDEHTQLEEAFNVFLAESQEAINSRNGVSPPWEVLLRQRAEWFKSILENPWGHPVLKVLLDPREPQPSTEEILEWLKEERGITFVTRLQQLAASKCNDLALDLASAVMDRVREGKQVVSDGPPPEGGTEPPNPEKLPTFEDILNAEAGFSDVWDKLKDIELVLLHKRDKNDKLFELAKQMPLASTYQVVERLQNRLVSFPREKKLWKNAKDVATVIAELTIARCMVIPECVGEGRTALYMCARHLVRLLAAGRLARACASLAVPARTAKHLYTFATAVHTQQTADLAMKPFVCELYVRALTVGMNELEDLRLDPKKEKEARRAEETLAQWFTQLGVLLGSSARMRGECALTAFSIHPTRAMFDRVMGTPDLPPVKDVQEDKGKEKNPETSSEFGSWANDSRSQTNFVKTSETLNIKHSQQLANVLSTAILNEAEILGLSPELCQDIANLLSRPRVKTLSWNMDREVVLENCRVHMELTHGGTRALTTELKYLNLDPSQFQHLPEEDDDDENDIYYGIEKGYEHLVEFEPQPEEIWQDLSWEDFEATQSVETSSIESDSIPQVKKKTRQISSEDESDPLSLVAETKKEKQKVQQRSKEPKKKKAQKDGGKKKSRSVSKERSLDRPQSQENSSQVQSQEKKKEKKQRKKKEKTDKPKKTKKGSLSKLVGLKVTNLNNTHLTNERSEICVTDSDYDSQGKSSLNSEETDPNLVYDGQYSMDEIKLKSPEIEVGERIKNLSLDKGNELHLSSCSVIVHKAQTPPKSSKVKPQNKTNSRQDNVSDVSAESKSTAPNQTSENTKKSLSKLLQFRKKLKAELNVTANKKAHAHKTNNTQSSMSDLIGSKITKTPKIPVNKKQSDQVNVTTNKVDNILETNDNNNKIICSRTTPYRPLSRKLPITTKQGIFESIARQNMPHTTNDTTQPSWNEQQNLSTQRSKSTINTKPNIEYSPGLAQTHPIASSTSHLKSYEDFVKEWMVKTKNENYALATEPPRREVRKDNRPTSRVSPIVPPNAASKATPYTPNVVGTARDIGTSNPTNAFTLTPVVTLRPTTIPITAFKSETVKSQCAKQQKKVENVPNTFARLSYMHKNKQSDKSKQPVDAQAQLDMQISAELDKRIADLRLCKLLQTKNDLVVSRVLNSSHLAKPTNPKVEVQIEPSAGTIGSEHSTICNILNYNKTNSGTRPTQKIEPTETPRLETPSSSKTSLSEKDQQDLLLLLRQQNKMNAGNPPKIDSNSVTTPSTTFSVPNTLVKQSRGIAFKSVSTSQVQTQNKTVIETNKTVCHESSTLNTTGPTPITITTKPNPKKTKSQSRRQNKNIQLKNHDESLQVQKASSKKYTPNNFNVQECITIKKQSSEDEQDWTKVFDALRAQKTPSRGPNALDVLLNKDSFQKYTEQASNENLDKTDTSLSLTTKKNVINVNQQSSNAPKVMQTSVVIRKQYPSKIRSKKIDNHQTEGKQCMKLPQKHQHGINIVEQELQKEDDPFISGIPNSDYEILEELMDDDLRQEIGELLSDEDSYRPPTNAILKTPRHSSTVVKTGSITDTNVVLSKTETIVNKSERKHCLGNTNILTTTVNQTIDPIKPSGLNIALGPKLKILSNEKVEFFKPSEIKLSRNSNVAQSLPPTTASNESSFRNVPASNPLNNNQIQQKPLINISPSNVFISAVPQSSTNVVMIGSEVVFDPFKVYQPSYVAVNGPNVNLYQAQTTPTVSSVLVEAIPTVNVNYSIPLNAAQIITQNVTVPIGQSNVLPTASHTHSDIVGHSQQVPHQNIVENYSKSSHEIPNDMIMKSSPASHIETGNNQNIQAIVTQKIHTNIQNAPVNMAQSAHNFVIQKAQSNESQNEHTNDISKVQSNLLEKSRPKDLQSCVDQKSLSNVSQKAQPHLVQKTQSNVPQDSQPRVPPASQIPVNKAQTNKMQGSQPSVATKVPPSIIQKLQSHTTQDLKVSKKSSKACIDQKAQFTEVKDLHSAQTNVTQDPESDVIHKARQNLSDRVQAPVSEDSQPIVKIKAPPNIVSRKPDTTQDKQPKVVQKPKTNVPQDLQPSVTQNSQPYVAQNVKTKIDGPQDDLTHQTPQNLSGGLQIHTPQNLNTSMAQNSQSNVNQSAQKAVTKANEITHHERNEKAQSAVTQKEQTCKMHPDTIKAQTDVKENTRLDMQTMHHKAENTNVEINLANKIVDTHSSITGNKEAVQTKEKIVPLGIVDPRDDKINLTQDKERRNIDKEQRNTGNKEALQMETKEKVFPLGIIDPSDDKRNLTKDKERLLKKRLALQNRQIDYRCPYPPFPVEYYSLSQNTESQSIVSSTSVAQEVIDSMNAVRVCKETINKEKPMNRNTAGTDINPMTPDINSIDSNTETRKEDEESSRPRILLRINKKLMETGATCSIDESIKSETKTEGRLKDEVSASEGTVFTDTTKENPVLTEGLVDNDSNEIESAEMKNKKTEETNVESNPTRVSTRILNRKKNKLKEKEVENAQRGYEKDNVKEIDIEHPVDIEEAITGVTIKKMQNHIDGNIDKELPKVSKHVSKNKRKKSKKLVEECKIQDDSGSLTTKRYKCAQKELRPKKDVAFPEKVSAEIQNTEILHDDKINVAEEQPTVATKNKLIKLVDDMKNVIDIITKETVRDKIENTLVDDSHAEIFIPKEPKSMDKEVSNIKDLKSKKTKLTEQPHDIIDITNSFSVPKSNMEPSLVPENTNLNNGIGVERLEVTKTSRAVLRAPTELKEKDTLQFVDLSSPRKDATTKDILIKNPNVPSANSSQAFNKNCQKPAVNDGIPQSYKDSIKIEELPFVDPNDPHKKMVRITVPSIPHSKVFKATIYGPANVNFDTLFQDQALRTMLTSGVCDKSCYTFNVQQFSTRQNEIIDTKISRINVEPPRSSISAESRIEDIETINLLSDDEEELALPEIFDFVTEFGKYKTNMTDKSLIMKHQHKLAQKCSLKLVRCDSDLNKIAVGLDPVPNNDQMSIIPPADTIPEPISINSSDQINTEIIQNKTIVPDVIEIGDERYDAIENKSENIEVVVPVLTSQVPIQNETIDPDVIEVGDDRCDAIQKKYENIEMVVPVLTSQVPIQNETIDPDVIEIGDDRCDAIQKKSENIEEVVPVVTNQMPTIPPIVNTVPETVITNHLVPNLNADNTQNETVVPDVIEIDDDSSDEDIVIVTPAPKPTDKIDTLKNLLLQDLGVEDVLKTITPNEDSENQNEPEEVIKVLSENLLKDLGILNKEEIEMKRPERRRKPMTSTIKSTNDEDISDLCTKAKNRKCFVKLVRCDHMVKNILQNEGCNSALDAEDDVLLVEDIEKDCLKRGTSPLPKLLRTGSFSILNDLTFDEPIISGSDRSSPVMDAFETICLLQDTRKAFNRNSPVMDAFDVIASAQNLELQRNLSSSVNATSTSFCDSEWYATKRILHQDAFIQNKLSCLEDFDKTDCTTDNESDLGNFSNNIDLESASIEKSNVHSLQKIMIKYFQGNALEEILKPISKIEIVDSVQLLSLFSNVVSENLDRSLEDTLTTKLDVPSLKTIMVKYFEANSLVDILKPSSEFEIVDSVQVSLMLDDSSTRKIEKSPENALTRKLEVPSLKKIMVKYLENNSLEEILKAVSEFEIIDSVQESSLNLLIDKSSTRKLEKSSEDPLIGKLDVPSLKKIMVKYFEDNSLKEILKPVREFEIVSSLQESTQNLLIDNSSTRKLKKSPEDISTRKLKVPSLKKIMVKYCEDNSLEEILKSRRDFEIVDLVQVSSLNSLIDNSSTGKLEKSIEDALTRKLDVPSLKKIMLKYFEDNSLIEILKPISEVKIVHLLQCSLLDNTSTGKFKKPQADTLTAKLDVPDLTEIVQLKSTENPGTIQMSSPLENYLPEKCNVPSLKKIMVKYFEDNPLIGLWKPLENIGITQVIPPEISSTEKPDVPSLNKIMIQYFKDNPMVERLKSIGKMQVVETLGVSSPLKRMLPRSKSIVANKITRTFNKTYQKVESTASQSSKALSKTSDDISDISNHASGAKVVTEHEEKDFVEMPTADTAKDNHTLSWTSRGIDSISDISKHASGAKVVTEHEEKKNFVEMPTAGTAKDNHTLSWTSRGIDSISDISKHASGAKVVTEHEEKNFVEMPTADTAKDNHTLSWTSRGIDSISDISKHASGAKVVTEREEKNFVEMPTADTAKDNHTLSWTSRGIDSIRKEVPMNEDASNYVDRNRDCVSATVIDKTSFQENKNQQSEPINDGTLVNDIKKEEICESSSNESISEPSLSQAYEAVMNSNNTQEHTVEQTTKDATDQADENEENIENLELIENKSVQFFSPCASTNHSNDIIDWVSHETEIISESDIVTTFDEQELISLNLRDYCNANKIEHYSEINDIKFDVSLIEKDRSEIKRNNGLENTCNKFEEYEEEIKDNYSNESIVYPLKSWVIHEREVMSRSYDKGLLSRNLFEHSNATTSGEQDSAESSFMKVEQETEDILQNNSKIIQTDMQDNNNDGKFKFSCPVNTLFSNYKNTHTYSKSTTTKGIFANTQVDEKIDIEANDHDYFYETEIIEEETKSEVSQNSDDVQFVENEIFSKNSEVSSELKNSIANTKTLENLKVIEETDEVMFEKSIEIVDYDENILEKDATLVYKDDSGVILKGIEYELPEVGTCYVFPLLKSPDVSSSSDLLDENSAEVESIEDLNKYLYDEDLKLMEPRVTYSRSKRKRKLQTDEQHLKAKRKRMGKNINVRKRNYFNNKDSYIKEYVRLTDYYSSVKLSFAVPYSIEYIDVPELIKNWPIKGPPNTEYFKDTDIDLNLFTCNDDRPSFESCQQSLSEEIITANIEGIPSDKTNDTNFSMGFGERSDRVNQNLIDDGAISKFSAATLSDVKQSQPFLLSEDYECNDKYFQELKELETIRRCINYFHLRDKIRSFFKNTLIELTKDLKKEQKCDKYEVKVGNTPFPFELYTKQIEPTPVQMIVQVVQVGQLPVSAAAQNPVTCDPRVTQVSDASPSQCSVENSPQDDSQQGIKTEYTELTTADLTLPLQDYVHHSHNTRIDVRDSTNGNENIPIETELIKSEVKVELEPEIPEDEECDKVIESNDQNTGHVNNVEYTFESNNTNESEQTLQMLFTAEKQNVSETFLHQKTTNGAPEKTDQIAHAMNAAGIATTAETNTNNKANTNTFVNLISQKIMKSAVTTHNSPNNSAKTASINAVALQQALAQILPPPLNQTNSAENNQQSQNTVTPQLLHIVQGKSNSGNQITLVENSQQSVINTRSATPVLHIVQNKQTTASPTSNGAPSQQTNFGGISLVDAGLHQGGNQLLHIVNTGNQKNNNAGQLLKRVNLLTNLANVQGANEQKMVQFVCKSADGKAIQLNAPHQRSMVLRLQPIESPNVQSATAKPEVSEPSPTSNAPTPISNKDTATNQQEIKSRSIYEENYAKFIQNVTTKTQTVEKSTSLPKFNQAFGKPVFQDGSQKQNEVCNTLSASANSENPESTPAENAINLDHMGQISSPPLLLRKSPATAQASQPQPNLVHQIKQTIGPMNIQTMHGGVIYTRQIPVNIGGGQTINLITVPSTELLDESGQKQQSEIKFQGDIEPSIIKIVPQTQAPPNAEVTPDEGNSQVKNTSTESTQNTQPQQVLTQMRIKLPMLSKTPQMVSGAKVVRPSFFQIQRNVIGGANQPVYQQLVLTAAPQLGQQTIRIPQTQMRPVKVESQTSSSESQMSSSTLEQLREFDMVLEQVKERSTGQPNSNSGSSFKLNTASTDTTDSSVSTSSAPTETTQVLYSIGSNQPLNVAYINRKATVANPTTSTFVRSPDSSGIVDSPVSSNHIQIPQTVTTEASTSESVSTAPKPKFKSKSRPKHHHSSVKINNSVPPKATTQKPLEDEQTTQRILYILAEYKEQVENSPDKDKPAPRRRSNPPINPSGSSKRKKSSSGSRRPGTRDLSPIHGDDTCRTMGSEDSSCGTSQGDCAESCLETNSPQDSPRKVVRKLTFEQETPVTPPRPQPQRNVIVADGQTITVARGTAGKPATAVLMPANYILPVSMVKGGQQIAIVTNRGPKLLTVGGGEGGATNALLLQRLIGPAGLKPVLTRPGVRHVRLPTAALHNLQAFNLATTANAQPPDSTASPAPAPTPPELIETRATSSPWTDRESESTKPTDRASSPEGSEPWNLPSSADPNDYSYEETVRADNLDRTVLDPIPDRYSPDMEAQRIFDKMFDVESKKSYIVDAHDSPRCGYDIDPSDCDDKTYQVVQKKDGSGHRQHRLTQVSAAALRHKYAILEHELRLQKSLSEECEDLGVDSPSASELFPEAELLFAASPAHDHAQDAPHHSNTPQPTILNQSAIQPDIDDQIATDNLLQPDNRDNRRELDNLGLMEDVGIVTVSEDGMQATIALDQEEFARSHPNTTFHSEPTDDAEVQPFTITGLKGRQITSTIFHANRAPATVLMTAPQTTVISQATAASSQNTVKYADIEPLIDHVDSIPGTHANNLNLSSVLVKDDGLTRFDNILNDSRELHLSNTASAIVHSVNNATQVIRRVCYEDDKRERDTSFLMDEPDALIAGDDAKMIAEDSSRDNTLESMPGDVDDDNSSPERHAELFWESNSASERSESRRPLDFSSDSDKCCKSPSFDETNSTDSSGVGTHMRLDSVIKEARLERSGSADGSSADDTHPPLRTYPPKRMYHSMEGEMERSLSGKTRAGERSPDMEVRRRASGRGVVKRGCHCCNGSPAPLRPKKPRQRKPTMDFSST